MVIIRDTREQNPLDFSRDETVVELGALEVGDYAPADTAIGATDDDQEDEKDPDPETNR